MYPTQGLSKHGQAIENSKIDSEQTDLAKALSLSIMEESKNYFKREDFELAQALSLSLMEKRTDYCNGQDLELEKALSWSMMPIESTKKPKCVVHPNSQERIASSTNTTAQNSIVFKNQTKKENHETKQENHETKQENTKNTPPIKFNNDLKACPDPGAKGLLQSFHINIAMNELMAADTTFQAFEANGCNTDNPIYKDILDENLNQLLTAKHGFLTDPLGGIDTQMIAFPININRQHWTVAVADTKNCSIYYYDSKGSRLDHRVTPRLNDLKDFMTNRQFILGINNKKEWKIIPANGHYQTDGFSCGDHIIQFVQEKILKKGDSNKFNVAKARKELRTTVKKYKMSKNGTLSINHK